MSLPLNLHVFGAAGSGVTSLGRALAQRLDMWFIDTDDVYWAPTNPPYQRKVPPNERVERIQQQIAVHPRWVISGSLCSWGGALISEFDAVIFLTVSTDIRMRRLRTREKECYGKRIEPGGDMHGKHLEFMAWASEYETGVPPLRSLAMHREWISELPCPFYEFENDVALDELLETVLAELGYV